MSSEFGLSVNQVFEGVLGRVVDWWSGVQVALWKTTVSAAQTPDAVSAVSCFSYHRAVLLEVSGKCYALAVGQAAPQTKLVISSVLSAFEIPGRINNASRLLYQVIPLSENHRETVLVGLADERIALLQSWKDGVRLTYAARIINHLDCSSLEGFVVREVSIPHIREVDEVWCRKELALLYRKPAQFQPRLCDTLAFALRKLLNEHFGRSASPRSA
ncbi:hypothetical protein EPN83_01910 [Patescibacteria group bacterium]|nr:MAG: hypothetical protein EPN83_01910 [Patescibacteria group bacterium]